MVFRLDDAPLGIKKNPGWKYFNPGQRLVLVSQIMPLTSMMSLLTIYLSVTLPLPRQRLQGCSCRSPLAHFYIHHARSSIRELHPFTTITHLASKNSETHSTEDDFPVQFLFRKQGTVLPPGEAAVAPLPLRQRIFRGKKQRVQSTQWTARLAAQADQLQPSPSVIRSSDGIDAEKASETSTPEAVGIDVTLRLEGPYFSPADPSHYDTVVCLVAGTGVSGALAIAAAFNAAAMQDSIMKETHIRKWRRCIIVWSVKDSDDIELPFIEPKAEGLELRKYLTGSGRARVDLRQELSEICVKARQYSGRSWVYISGPNKYIESGKEACKEVE